MRDAAGREVRLEAPAKRIVTNEPLLLLSLALIDPEPVSKLAGWAAPQRFDRGMYTAFLKRFPAIDNIPVVGAVMPANVSVESILSVDPDLFVVSLWQPGWEGAVQLLDAAGVPVIFLDGPENDARGPAEATGFSMRLLGKAIGQEAEANAFADFVKQRYQLVTERLKGVIERPEVLIDAHAGTLCCAIPGAHNRITEMMRLAGGHSVGSDDVPGYDGQINAEFVLGVDPRVYIGTGGPHLAAQGGLVVGGGVNAANARASLEAVTGRNLLGQLSAVREGRAFGVSHQLSISALSVLVFECFATWGHPELFADLDPARTLAEINSRFMAVPLEGTFWIGLDQTTGP
ncbi:iron complex transport system substrate-binding protein [Aminobacter lissarensis]|uniref:Iron complex transport system substrate-binding protein n=1 Tax=Aminobacter carboxidus TaxID=376165 RepID=A0A8E1WID3_9HYPH|nr:ABC transporter substrate-binding protein [Aminobacter lissarensis]MBB6468449.1 iron complex transport system substrate-binding protein [Aminobacter lissarensis]